ncbi:MAG TPA: hypothetical protein VH251_06635 [Verrucomicrobiae bacterium]|nr:hypothetical protein [Verrucomicrobiae bacterium]
MFAFVGLASCVIAQAGDSGYTTIAARNVFGLLPQEVIVVPPTPPPPLPKITLDGFMTVFGRPQVLFKAARSPTAGGLTENVFVLGESEKGDDITVVQIDMTAKTVTFSNHGTLQQISLTDRK